MFYTFSFQALNYPALWHNEEKLLLWKRASFLADIIMKFILQRTFLWNLQSWLSYCHKIFNHKVVFSWRSWSEKLFDGFGLQIFYLKKIEIEKNIFIDIIYCSAFRSLYLLGESSSSMMENQKQSISTRLLQSY